MVTQKDTSRDKTAGLLLDAMKAGIIDDIGCIEDRLKEMKRKEILKNVHIWYNETKGCYFAHMYDTDGKRRLIRRATKNDLEDEIVRRTIEESRTPTFGEVFNEWNNTRAARGFIEASTRDINRELFDRFLGQMADRKMSGLTPGTLASYLEDLAGGGCMTAKAFSNVKGLVKGTVKAAKREGYVSFNGDDVEHELDIPERAFRVVKKPDKDEIFSNEELTVIIGYLKTHTKNIRNLAILFLFITGLRVGELTALTWENVHDAFITVCATETREKDDNGKWMFYVRDNAKTVAGVRSVPIPDSYRWIWDAIREAAGNESGYVFVNESGGRINAQSIRKRLTRLLKKLKLPHRSPHKIRKTYCSILFERGVDPKIIERLMGHVDVSISEQFYHRDRYGMDEKERIVSSIFS